MSYMKQFAMEVSEDMGMGGELTDVVLREAQRRLDTDEHELSGDIEHDAIRQEEGAMRDLAGIPNSVTGKEFGQAVWVALCVTGVVANAADRYDIFSEACCIVVGK